MNPTQERWLPVPGFEGYYEVSDHGRVRSVTRRIHLYGGRTPISPGRVLKPDTSHWHRVKLSKDGQVTRKSVHRLVLEAFVGPCPEGMECCHWDDDHTNNHLSNLRWDTRSANRLDAVRNGIHVNAAKTHCKRGHEYSEANTYRDRQGSRQCRRCHADRERRRKAGQR